MRLTNNFHAHKAHRAASPESLTLFNTINFRPMAYVHRPTPELPPLRVAPRTPRSMPQLPALRAALSAIYDSSARNINSNHTRARKKSECTAISRGPRAVGNCCAWCIALATEQHAVLLHALGAPPYTHRIVELGTHHVLWRLDTALKPVHLAESAIYPLYNAVGSDHPLRADGPLRAALCRLQ